MSCVCESNGAKMGVFPLLAKISNAGNLETFRYHRHGRELLEGAMRYFAEHGALYRPGMLLNTAIGHAKAQLRLPDHAF